MNSTGKRFREKYGFERIEQQGWETPVSKDWIDTLDKAVSRHPAEEVILVGHSFACTTITNRARKCYRSNKVALLVAPSDTGANTYPEGTTGFSPIPTNKLTFHSIVIASSVDFYVAPERAKYLVDSWGSSFVNIGAGGHINPTSGLGD